MINVTLKGEQVAVKPATLHRYIEKVEYIKSRRLSPIDALKNLPAGITQDNYAKMVEIAISSSMRMSSVPFEEEMLFEGSQEGFYYNVYQALRDHFKWGSDGLAGVDKAERFYESLDEADKISLRLAMRGVDERSLAKNSDGPTPQEGPGSESQESNPQSESSEP